MIQLLIIILWCGVFQLSNSIIESQRLKSDHLLLPESNTTMEQATSFELEDRISSFIGQFLSGGSTEETSDAMRQAITKNRLKHPVDPSEPCKNDSMRIAALGIEKYSKYISKSLTKNIQYSKKAPVWLMRQAGRYLPEFRKIRKEYDFLQVCKDPLLAATVTLQPLQRYSDLDAVIIFTDILVIPEAMGMGLTFSDGIGPRFDRYIQTPDDINSLDMEFDMEEKLGYVFDAISVVYGKLKSKVPIIGFSGAPLTLLMYMIQNPDKKKDYAYAKTFIRKYPEAATSLLSELSKIIIQYLEKQIISGAKIIQLFDTNATFFSPEEYLKWGVQPLLDISKEIKNRFPSVPLIVFSRNRSLQMYKSLYFDVISISWEESRDTVVEKFQSDTNNFKALQGNLDPHTLYAPTNFIFEETQTMVKEFTSKSPRYIANLGHGMEPEMDPEAVATFIKAVKSVIIPTD